MSDVPKTRFGFHERSTEPTTMPSTRSSPDLTKSCVSKENLVLYKSSSSVSTQIGEIETSSCSYDNQQSFDFSDDDPSFWKDHNVQVIIRVRPLSSSEISVQGVSRCIKQESSQTITWTGHPETRFTFDIVADETVTQEKMFKSAGVPMVENCVGGYNSCMFAYGQTGSGKTHTMLGDIEGGTRRNSVNCGMTPRVFEYLFQRIQKEKEARRDEKLRFICKCSFLEIYNEHILDLLDPSSSNLQIREDIKKGVYVENLKEFEVTSARDVMQQLIQGSANRKVASTNMNRASSRSHSVFTCIIESEWESQGVNHHRFARLNLVDLAGSERQKSSGAEGERLKEATNINKSLSTLGLVIMNLVNLSNGKSLHVPYRDSKLTFLLQDSLGGNSKTIIIANISPSNCCSLETLSTLKFAQRAKFLKNNAIVNEDTSGDVLVMRMQIQQLKKEVSRLRGLAAGGDDGQEIDTCQVSFPGSPGSFKWEGLQGSFSPFTSNKVVSQKKDIELALVWAFKREKDKDLALQALVAENKAAMQLAKQRADEIQSLKMRLRFREAGIKRLESVSFGKISAETHLLKENEEHLKEIEILRAQVDRNQEATRFAMENLRLTEEIRRLKSYCEEGEREMMNEQINTLQNKLMEALDWKLMHSDSSAVLDFGSPLRSSNNEENEFLRIQAIQNQAEMDSLRHKLNSCLEEKEKLERHSDELEREVEELRSSSSIAIDSAACMKEEEETETVEDITTTEDKNNNNIDLKTLVDAIAGASEREAEAHETAILLSKENDQLRMKFKVLVEDNNKLIDIYERAVASLDNNSEEIAAALVQETEFKKIIQNLEHELGDLHEENERLMGLYEKAMQERDEFQRLFVSSGQSGEGVEQETKGESINCLTPSLVEKDQVDNNLVSNEPLGYSEVHDLIMEEGNIGEVESSILTLVKMKVDGAHEQVLSCATTASLFGLFENRFVDIVTLSREIKASENCILVKQQELEIIKVQFPEIQVRTTVINKKLSALRYALSSFIFSIPYFEQREARARAKVKASSPYLFQKKQELLSLLSLKTEIKAHQIKIQQSEVATRNNLGCLKSKLEEEKQRQETENGAPFSAIDHNVEKSMPDWHLGGAKASEILKSEEEKAKLQNEMKLCRETLGVIKREIEVLNTRFVKVENEIQVVEKEIQKGMKSVEDMELGLQNVIHEKELLLEMRDKGINEIENMIIEYQHSIFVVGLKEAEIEVTEDELFAELRRREELLIVRDVITDKTTELVEDMRRYHSCLLSERMIHDLHNVQQSLVEATHC